MSVLSPADESLPLSQTRAIDRACDDFEKAWEAGDRPCIEAYLAELPQLPRSALLRALLQVELEYRRKTGARPDADAYRQRFPDDAELIDDLFRDAAADPSGTPEEHPASCVAALLAPGSLVGDYRLLEEIGKGGMGIVYRALQLRVPRIVALKVIRADRLDELPPERRRVWVERFTTEARALAQLDHIHIVTVHDVGEHQGLPFYAMRYVEGTTLAEVLRDGRPLPGRKAATYLEPLARAVHHAHQRGILHRDLKPKNILIELTSDQPCVVDFGLAKLLQGDPGPTVTGDLIGSPPYLPPEQARKPDAVSVAADVYGLGATLYHLLTGRPPFQAPTVAETILQVVNDEPLPPRHLNPSLDRDLETICLKCLEKEPTRRYPTTAGLADDLAHYLRGEPIRARPPGRVERLWRWCRRNRATALTAAAAAASLLLALAALIWGLVEAEGRAHQQGRTAEEARHREREQRRAVVRQQLLVARMEEHYNGWRDKAFELVKQGALLGGADLELRSELVAALEGVDAQLRYRFEPLSASSVALSPKGDRLLIGGADVEGRPEAAAQLRDNLDGAPVHSHQQGAGPVVFRESDGAALQLVARPGPSALLWDVGKQRPVGTFRFADLPGPERIVAFARTDLDSAVLALAPDGAGVAAVAVTSGGTSRLAVWDSGSGKRLLEKTVAAEALAFSAQGDWLAAGTRDGRVTVWSVADGAAVEMPPLGAAVRSLGFSRDGYWLAAGDSGGSCTVWNWRQRAVQSINRGGHYDVYAVAFSPDGTSLAIGGRGHVRLTDTATGRPLLSLHSGDFIGGLSFTADGRRLAASGLTVFSPGRVIVWDLEAGRGIQTLQGLSGQVSRICICERSQRLAALAHDWQVAIWDLANGRLLRRMKATPGVLADNSALIFSPDGRQLALAAGTEACLWEVATGRELGRWQLPRGLLDQLIFHPQSGELLLFRLEKPRDTTTGTCVIRALRKEGAPQVARLAEPYRRLYAAASVASDTCILLEGIHESTKGPQRTIRCVSWLTGKEHWALPSVHHGGDSAMIVPSSDGRLATIHPDGRDTSLQLVEAESGRQVATLPVQPFGLSPGAEWMVVGKPSTTQMRMGFTLYRGKDSTPLLLFGKDTWRALPDGTFSRQGRLLAWNNGHGTISVCDLKLVQATLADAGLGW